MIYSPEKMDALRKAYRRIPPDVIEDLAQLGFANAPTHTEREQGMRDVWLHINNFLNLDRQQIFEIFAGRGVYFNPEE